MEQIKHDIELQIADWRAKATLHCSNSLIPRTCLVRTPVIKTLSPSDLQLRMFIASQAIQAIVYYGSSPSSRIPTVTTAGSSIGTRHTLTACLTSKERWI